MQASFQELQRLAASKGVDLLHAYLEAGCADSTYYRHQLGRNGMTVTTYNALLSAIDKLARQAA